MITPHGAVYNSTRGRLLTVSLTSPVAWELLAGGGPGLVHLCVRPPVLRAERMLLKDVSSSQVRDGRLIQMTPLLSDCSRSPWHLVLGDRSVVEGGGTEAPSCRGSSLPLACPRSSETRPSSATAVLGLSSTHPALWEESRRVSFLYHCA